MPENKKKRIKRIVLGILVLVVALIWSLPKKKEYIITPSTHDEVIFLDVEEKAFSNGSKVWFALYDPECEYIELCLSFPQGYVDPHMEAHTMEILKEGNAQISWAHASYSRYRKNIWRKHLVILVENAGNYNEVTLRYLGEEVTITR